MRLQLSAMYLRDKSIRHSLFYCVAGLATAGHLATGQFAGYAGNPEPGKVLVLDIDDRVVDVADYLPDHLADDGAEPRTYWHAVNGRSAAPAKN